MGAGRLDVSVTLSLGEIRALSVKAMRGNGCVWGMADEAGWSVRWLESMGLPGAGALAAWLNAEQDGGQDRCPVCAGVAFADSGDAAGIGGGPVGQPLLALPFLARHAPAGGALRVTVGDVPGVVWPEGAAFDAPVPETGQVVLIGPVDAADAPPTIPNRGARAHVPDDALATLHAFAARTYAPATEASRAKGAGAGLLDND